MVEKLSERYPEFGQRVRERAKAKSITIRDIERGLKVTYEMARRYYNGIAKPRGKRMETLALLLGSPVAWLEYGAPASSSAKEPATGYATIDEDARDVAIAWSLLPESKKQLYKEAIFRDAAMKEIMPEQYSVPIRSSYFKFVSSVRHSWEKTLRQLKLEL